MTFTERIEDGVERMTGKGQELQSSGRASKKLGDVT